MIGGFSTWGPPLAVSVTGPTGFWAQDDVILIPQHWGSCLRVPVLLFCGIIDDRHEEPSFAFARRAFGLKALNPFMVQETFKKKQKRCSEHLRNSLTMPGRGAGFYELVPSQRDMVLT